MSNITYVTYLIHVSDDRVEYTQRLKWLEPLLSLNIDLIIFTDEFYKDKLPVVSNLRTRIVVVDYTSLDTVRAIQDAGPLYLPYTRNLEKDTLNFMCLMNSKPELLALAKDMCTTPYLAYLDAGLSKVLKTPSQTLARLESLKVTSIPLVLLPGCHPIGPREGFPGLWKGIHWMLSGGFFVVPRTCVDEFYGLHMAALKKYLALKSITWEVNVWASFANSVKERVVWYNGPHNDEMITGIPSSVLLQ